MCRQQEMRETQSFLLQIDLCGPQVFFTGHCGFIIIYKKKKNCVGYFLIIRLMWTVRQLSGYLPLKDFLYLTVVIIQYNGCA